MVAVIRCRICVVYRGAGTVWVGLEDRIFVSKNLMRLLGAENMR